MSDCPVSVCILCHAFEKTEKSVNWCTRCGGGICSGCSGQHQSSNDFSNHRLVPVVDSGKLSPLSNLRLNCEEHKVQNEFYCKKHRTEVCSECLSNHRGCNIVCTFQNSKENFQEVESILFDIKIYIDKLTLIVRENAEGLVEQRERLQEEIRLVRINVNQTLDKLEANINNELLETESTGHKLIKTTLDSLSETQEQVSECESDLSIIKQYATNISDYKVFLSKIQVENKALKLEESVHAFISENKVNHLSLLLKVDDKIFNLAKIENFGKVIIEKGRLQLIDEVSRQIGQNRIKRIGTEGRSIDNIQPTLLERVDSRRYEILGCALLPDGKTVLSRSAYPSCVTLLRSDGSVEDDFEGIQVAYGVSPLDENTIAISAGNGILIFDLLSKRTKLKYPCSSFGGIAATDKSFVCCSARNKIEMINTGDFSVTNICTYYGKEYPYIAELDNNLYLTNKSFQSVVCYDIKGEIIWTFKDTSVLKEPRGITIDGNGNVYVTDSLLSKVIVISPDGERYLELLDREDGVNEAWSVHCDRETNKLLVANKSGTILLFSLDYKQVTKF